MNKGKIIVIEGTDCSGKETQSNILKEKLEADGYKVYKTYFPTYETPTGKIIGGPYLGKASISNSWFKEEPVNVDYLVASAFYAADRRYNIPIINKYLEEGYIIILDRYVSSNMAHQGGKILDKKERLNMYKKLEILEYEIMELPKPDLTVLLYMPYDNATLLKESRDEEPDGHEIDTNHLINAEKAYLELADIYSYKKIDCVFNNQIKTIEKISEEVYNIVSKEIR